MSEKESEKECPCCLCDEHKWMSRAQVADHLGLHYLTIRRMVKDGKLPEYIGSARTIRYKVADVNKIMKRNPIRSE